MSNKILFIVLSIVFVLLLAGFAALELLPFSAREKLWPERQDDTVKTVWMWCTISFGALLAVIVAVMQIRSRAGRKRAGSVGVRPVAAEQGAAAYSAALDGGDVAITVSGAPVITDAAAGEEPAAEVHNKAGVIPGNAQHIGAREEQQDSFCFSALDDEEAVSRYGAVAVLADGMGGLAMGREASRLAVQTLLGEYSAKSAEEPVPQTLQRAIKQANRVVYELALAHELEWSVGTTAIAAVVQEGLLYWISAGDSRIYLYRDGALSPLTYDHVYANRLYDKVKAGEMTREEAETHPERQLLTSYLGIPELTEIDGNVLPFRLQPEDWILLCSDGVYPSLSERVMAEASKLSPQSAAEYILRQTLAEERPYQDNATIAILKYTGA